MELEQLVLGPIQVHRISRHYEKLQPFLQLLEKKGELVISVFPEDSCYVIISRVILNELVTWDEMKEMKDYD